jgi:hypothetical protein
MISNDNPVSTRNGVHLRSRRERSRLSAVDPAQALFLGFPAPVTSHDYLRIELGEFMWKLKRRRSLSEMLKATSDQVQLFIYR